jgi:hypothetical protein
LLLDPPQALSQFAMLAAQMGRVGSTQFFIFVKHFQPLELPTPVQDVVQITRHFVAAK